MTTTKTPSEVLEILGLSQVDNTSDADKPISTAMAEALAGKANARISNLAISASDRPGDNPDAFSTALSGSGRDKAPLNVGVVASVASLGRVWSVTGAATFGQLEPFAIGSDVWEGTLRVLRLSDPADANNHAVKFGVVWLDAAKSEISRNADLFVISDLTQAAGLREVSVRVSQLPVAGVVTPAAGAVYGLFFVQTFGDDGVTGIDTLRTTNVTDVHGLEPGNISQVIADARAATDQANSAASLVRNGVRAVAGGPVVAATTADVATTGDINPVDGVTLVNGDRYLRRAQSNASENGVFIFNDAGPHARADDFDAPEDVTNSVVNVASGSTQVGFSYVTYSSITTMGTDPIDWIVLQTNAGVFELVGTFEARVAQLEAQMAGLQEALPLQDIRVTVPDWDITEGLVKSAPVAPSAPIIEGSIITGYPGFFTLDQTFYIADIDTMSAGFLTASGPALWSISGGLDAALFTVDDAQLLFNTPSTPGVYAVDVTGRNIDTQVTTPIEVLVREHRSLAYGVGHLVLYLIAGQSNALGVGSSKNDYVGADYPDGILMVKDNAGTIVPAQIGVFSNWVTYGLQFAKDFVRVHPGANLALAQVAYGGTGFEDNSWNPGDIHYEEAVQRVNSAMTALRAANPDRTVIFGGILWHQGEDDRLNPNFQSALDAMIQQIRIDIVDADETTPFIAGQLSQVSPNYGATNAIIADLPNRVPHTAFVSSVGAGVTSDNVHFNQQGRDLLGRRYVRALDDARNNIQG
ncbi:sialate O-acetylesterase [Loktanella sp. TSTF-M6]|uniref:Sialate O-acetylesterase n=1 Tax=Loktanella gaetbuli TaxID=2881335 RepID=A0ABS8BTE6_9RHOB|nr:sialate O-acetylesterase [Loktanella gaetbuli]MCB5199015.1 sialate O-acetylesterase [Loktanella gaetbuli]